MRTIDEQFAALPPRVKSHLFSVLDRVAGLSQQEKRNARQIFDHESIGKLPEPVPELMKALSGLLFAVQTEADPELRRVHDLADEVVEQLRELGGDE